LTYGLLVSFVLIALLDLYLTSLWSKYSRIDIPFDRFYSVFFIVIIGLAINAVAFIYDVVILKVLGRA